MKTCRRLLSGSGLALLVLLFTPAFATQTALAQDEGDNTEEATGELRFPLLTLAGNFGPLMINDAGGVFGSVEANLDTDEDWLYGEFRALVGTQNPSSDGMLLTEFSGHLHLLAIGISDITYRHYLDGHEFRLLTGFSYSKQVEDVVRVDVNLGFAYFDERIEEVHINQFGLQVSARVTASIWQIHNTFALSVFQNVRLNDASIDLSDTEIVCSNFAEVLTGEDLVCTFPEPEEDSGGGSILDWEHTGVLLRNRTFMWVYEDGEDFRVGPELEVRFEHVPLRAERFMAMLSVRGQFVLQR